MKLREAGSKLFLGGSDRENGSVDVVQVDLMERPVVNLCLALLVTHYRIPHFYLIHR
jgi:hypothetical protein